MLLMILNIMLSNDPSLPDELIKSWHPYKNGNLSPVDISRMSNKKVWWICEKGHEWQAIISNRTGVNRTGCPYCSGKRATQENNLEVLFPDLMLEWDFTRNEGLSPNTLLPYSHKKVWWTCNKGHVWKTGISYRTKQGSGCPYCSGRSAGSDNSLAVLFPELSKEWDDEKNGILLPDNVRPGTDRKVWWKCEHGHSWQAPVCQRTHDTKSTGCPYCSGRNATENYNLAILFPEIAKEWHPVKNGSLKPENLRPSSNRKIWWRCIRGHEWRTSPNKRTGRDKTACPFCNPQTSRLEIRILCELRYLFPAVKWRAKLNRIEADIYVPQHLLAIEVDGHYWHINKEETDRTKGYELKKQGVTLFRLRDKRLARIEPTDTFYTSGEEDADIVHRLFMNILKSHHLENSVYDNLKSYCDSKVLHNEKEYQTILNMLPSPPSEYSLAELYGDLVREWDYEKNFPLIPENFTAGSGMKVWWTCLNGHGYKSLINSRTKGVGCPYCAGKKVSEDNNFQIKSNRELLGEWNYLRNNIKPNRIYYQSTKKIWWKCIKGHEWEASPRSRILGSGCPFCSGRKVSADNNLASLFPEIAKEWNYQRNNLLAPEQVTAKSDRKVWWKCKKGHEWQTIVSNRTGKKSGCPYCRGQKVSTENNLAILFPRIALEWDFEKNSPLTPENVTGFSNKKVWWVCSRNHRWQSIICNRTKQNRGCPYCKGNCATEDNNLQALFPELMKEWDFEKNINVQPMLLLPYSNQKIWWKCIKGHEWKARIVSRTKDKSKCPYCSGRYPTEQYNLSVLFPQIAKEWDYERNDIKPENVTPKSGKRIWWKCTKGHEWQAVIANRANGGGCPICANQRKKEKMKVES